MPSLFSNTEDTFIDIFLSKSKPNLVGVLYQLLDKPDFLEHLHNTQKKVVFLIFNIA